MTLKQPSTPVRTRYTPGLAYERGASNPPIFRRDQLGITEEEDIQLIQICHALETQRKAIYGHATDDSINRYLEIRLTVDAHSFAERVWIGL